MTVTIPDDHHRLLTSTAAEHLGLVSARAIARTGSFQLPDDALGALLCEAWLVDPASAKQALTAYMIGLRLECKRRDAPPPPLHEIVHSLRHTVDTARFPDLDIPAMCDSFEDEVPALYGTDI